MIHKCDKPGRPHGRPDPVALILGHPGEPFSTRVRVGAWRNQFTDEREVSARAVDFEAEFEDLQPAAAAMTIFNSARDIP